MQFRLTYEGELKSTGNKGNPKHVHEIRRQFRLQLRQFWLTHPWLKKANAVKETSHNHWTQINPSLRDYLALQFARVGYNFVPLVTERLSLACGLDVLFIRPSMPGEIMKSGDVDGRLKTLFDALRMPGSKDELGGYVVPDADEKPFDVLLEEDKLITHISVTTDVLLQPTGKSPDPVNDVRLVVLVTIKPVNQGWHNINFGGA